MTLATGSSKRGRRGFSLIEIMVVLALVAIFVAIAIPTFRSLSGTKLKSTANQLMGLVRDTYARASLSGKICRIVFDLDQKEYWVEEVTGQGNKDQEFDDQEFKAVEDELGQKQKLSEDVYFRSIWTDRLAERVASGQAALYFFPDGYTEEAQIVISDDPEGKRIFDLMVEPLTGMVVIEDKEMPLK